MIFMKFFGFNLKFETDYYNLRKTSFQHCEPKYKLTISSASYLLKHTYF